MDEKPQGWINLFKPKGISSFSAIYKIKKKFNIVNNSQLPEISRFDPVAQSLCMRPGEVCEILRPSKTAIKSPYYRICI